MRASMRIVSLVPSLSETLATWDITPVGVTDWCVAPEFPDAARVRGTKNPDLAAIVALQPDLVIANQEENRRIDVERLREAGLAVYVTSPDTLAQVADTFDRLGAVLGAEAPAGALATAIRAALNEPAPAGLRTFCPIWRDPWIAVGTGTIAADLLAHAGFQVVPDAPRYPRVELSEVADVEVVLLPDEPYEFGPADAAEFAGWRARVRLVDGAALTWWGPRTVAALASFRELASEFSS
jgi:ABC-type Fe3+-hydroxamate transport system substrate-binding protein